MTLIRNDGTTKELDSKVKAGNPWPIVLLILLTLSFTLNVAQYLKINLLEKQGKVLESINELYKSSFETPKPQFKMFIKVTPKIKKEVNLVKVVAPIKKVYKEFNPVISTEQTLLIKSDESIDWLKTYYTQEYTKIALMQHQEQIKHEEKLVNELNSDLSVLLNVLPEKTVTNKFLQPIQNKTKLQKFKETSKHLIIPLALSIFLKVVIP